MKNYLLGLFAIVLAIGFSAFSTSKKTSDSSGLQMYSYWYTVNGTQVDQEFYSGTAVDKDHVPNSPCDGGADICLVGSPTQLSHGTGIPAAEPDEDNYIREDFQ